MPERRLCEGGCGRWLTSPEAVALGYGRVCAERLGIESARSARPRRLRPVLRPADTPSEPIPGQTELPLQSIQPSLWSL
ncbi:DUF6011 domain-containing protein [Streptomyces pimonensis]|uniref:DUF6011 domain-containing protein n=1 Tax=Streptomyces pimonensis TaxID=2860288 RepID=UPI003528E819